jgi:hypothetical protein
MQREDNRSKLINMSQDKSFDESTNDKRKVLRTSKTFIKPPKIDWSEDEGKSGIKGKLYPQTNKNSRKDLPELNILPVNSELIDNKIKFLLKQDAPEEKKKSKSGSLIDLINFGIHANLLLTQKNEFELSKEYLNALKK